MKNTLKWKAFLTGCAFTVSLCSAWFPSVVYAETVQPTEEMTITLDDAQICYEVPILYDENASEDFRFYDQLDTNNQTVYDALFPLCEEPSEETVSITLPEAVTLAVSSSNINNWTEEEKNTYYTSMIMAVQPGVVALTLDEPMLFWVNLNQTSMTPVNMNISRNRGSSSYNVEISELTLSVGYSEVYGTMEDIQQMKMELEEVITAFPIEGETDAEKCESIHDALIAQITYDATADFMSSIAGSLLEPYHAVCEGYSKAFKALCDREQIPCIAVVGNYDRENLTAHMWNYVQLDGAWYGVDTTWGDSSSSDMYLLRGASAFLSNHTPESVYPDITLYFPELSETDYYVVTTTTETTTTTATTTTTTATTETSESEYTTTEATTTESETTMETTTTEMTTTTETTTIATTIETTICESTTPSSQTTTESSETTTTNGLTAATSTETEEITTVTTITSMEETTTTTTEPFYAIGDCNQDGMCNIADYVMLRKFLLAIPDIPCTVSMDCNADSKVNIMDAVYLFRICFL